MPRTQRTAEYGLLRLAGEALKQQGLGWEVLAREPAGETARPDATVRVRYPGGELDLTAEVEIRPRREVVGAALERAGRLGLRPLLVADYVNPRLADWLRDRGFFFVDAAGNAYLQGKGLYVWVTGRRDALRLQAERERRRAFRPAGLRVLFAILCRPDLAGKDYRTLAREADVALGTVQRVMRDLIEEGYVLRLGRDRRRLVEPKALLNAWTPAYIRDLRPTLILGRFEAPRLDWWRETKVRDYRALWGGEPAAALWTGRLEPGTLTLYVDEIPARLIGARRLEKNDRGRIEFRRKFWRLETVEKADAAPPILVYGDLLATGDARAIEAAAQVFRERIDGPFEAYLARRAR